MTREERRKHPRFAVDAPARLTVAGETQVGRVRDICKDAVLVEANRWYPLGTQAALEADLPGLDGPIRVEGTIIRLAPGQEGTHGMAILFGDVPPVSEMRIDFFISEHET